MESWTSLSTLLTIPTSLCLCLSTFFGLSDARKLWGIQYSHVVRTIVSELTGAMIAEHTFSTLILLVVGDFGSECNTVLL
ncbi:hypothetical protein XELAEV_18011396mg [Xenopus laevis]|uniref:Uncharacterized protein n=1 Tax=Xenopus laevis TaxID=8355 RepID=A0A974DM70_XENLA|nr:hypothetical protein XELAEV_18011396mg [Xenopus laevis]